MGLYAQRSIGGGRTGFMTHRLREAMKSGPLPQFGGEGVKVEIDETFIGKKEGRPVERGYAHKHAVMTLIERRPEGGRACSFHVDGTKASDLMPIIKANVKPGTHVMTDESGQYATLTSTSPLMITSGMAPRSTSGAKSTSTRPRGSIPCLSAGGRVFTSITAKPAFTATSRNSISATTTACDSGLTMLCGRTMRRRESLASGSLIGDLVGK